MENREEMKRKIESMSKEELVDFYMEKDSEISKKNLEIDNMNSEIVWYKEQLALMNKLRYSTKSEKTICGQLNLFNEVEDTYDMPVEETVQIKVKKKKSREVNFSKLPTKTIHHELENKECEICGTKMKELAPQTIDVLKYQPARYVVERHIVHQYICPTCTDENLEAEIVVAEGAPKRLIKGSVVSPSVVAGIVFNKYVSGTPLYRQEQELKRKKVEISRANMSNWLMKCGELLKPLYEQMQVDLRGLSHIHMDETTVVVLEDKQQGNRSKSYMWLAASGKHENKQMAVYRYHENREYTFAKEMIGSDYRGGIHCDGYEAYHKFEHAKIYGCMAHARRYFVEAMEVNPHHKSAKGLKGDALKRYCEEHPTYGNLMRIVNSIRELFQMEKSYVESQLTIEQIKEKRQVEQKPKLEELFTYLEKIQGEYTTKSKTGNAITYALNQKQYLMKYLEDGASEISNNRGERMIKPFVMGRKAWLFSNTKSGAEMSSVYYSLIESAKLNNLDIHDYLEYILTQIQNQGNQTDIQTLLPYFKGLPDTVRIDK